MTHHHFANKCIIFCMKLQTCFILIRGDNVKKGKEIIITDPFGSYTGLTKDLYEKPVQDADDL